MNEPLLAWIQKLAVYTWGLKSIRKSYNIHTCFPIISSNDTGSITAIDQRK